MVGRKTSGACILAALNLFAALADEPRARIELNGRWEFRMDPANAGNSERWFADQEGFRDAITVPGAWQVQGFGEPSGNLRHHYAGPAWYRRSIVVPESWRGKDVFLRIGGAHRRTTVFVNGTEAGGHEGFSAPFQFDVTRAIRLGAQNQIVLRIENPPVNIEVSPDKQEAVLPTGMLNYIANWGGIYGDVTLEAVPRTRIDSVLIMPDVERRQATFRIAVHGASDVAPLSVRIRVPSGEPVTARVSGEEAAATVPLPTAPLWTPENPALVTAAIELVQDGRAIDGQQQRFGFRQFTTRANVLLLNGKPIYLRGYGDDNVEVLTGFPPSDRSVFVDRLKLAKSFGFNAVRFHSMVPPAEYFEAADEVGMLVMAELPAAYTQYFFAHRDFLKRELRDVLLAYRNHPSLLSLAFGNEFNLGWLKTDADRKSFLASIEDFYTAAKQLAPATLIMSNDGFDVRPTDMVSVYHGFPPDRPTVRHEFGQYYCSLPDIGLIERFTGVLKPDWLEDKRKWVAANGLASSYETYLSNSRTLQQLGRKFQIERARANPDVTGYHYWLIVDFPGGTGEGDSWEEGWFDYFWQPKVPPEQGRELNAPVLLMVNTGVDNRTLWAGERKRVGVRVSNYGEEAIEGGRLSWELRSGDRRLAGSELAGVRVPLGAVADIGEVWVDATGIDASKKLDLVLTLHTNNRSYTNRWSYWAFARPSEEPAGVPVVSTVRSATLKQKYPWMTTDATRVDPRALLVTEDLDRIALDHLRAGGRVWLLLPQSPEHRGIQFFPAAGGAFGTVVAGLQQFPHESFCDLQFYNLIQGAFPLPVDRWPAEVNPIIGGIRTTSEFLSKTKNLSRVAYAVEAKAGGGKLLVTTLRLREHLDDAYPEAFALFDSLLRYAASPSFDPRATLPEHEWQRLASE